MILRVLMRVGDLFCGGQFPRGLRRIYALLADGVPKNLQWLGQVAGGRSASLDFINLEACAYTFERLNQIKL